jgi:hypothetical protein
MSPDSLQAPSSHTTIAAEAIDTIRLHGAETFPYE